MPAEPFSRRKLLSSFVRLAVHKKTKFPIPFSSAAGKYSSSAPAQTPPAAIYRRDSIQEPPREKRRIRSCTMCHMVLKEAAPLKPCRHVCCFMCTLKWLPYREEGEAAEFSCPQCEFSSELQQYREKR
ncbi:hypothetical protein RUND412_003727 [Rhizina undulata]